MTVHTNKYGIQFIIFPDKVMVKCYIDGEEFEKYITHKYYSEHRTTLTVSDFLQLD